VVQRAACNDAVNISISSAIRVWPLTTHEAGYSSQTHCSRYHCKLLYCLSLGLSLWSLAVTMSLMRLINILLAKRSYAVG